MQLDETHDPLRQSWVSSAQDINSDFPIQNLPFGSFARSGESFRVGVAIGSYVLDLPPLLELSIWSVNVRQALQVLVEGGLNQFMLCERAVQKQFRREISQALTLGSPHQTILERFLVPQDECVYALPFEVADYTDFYTGIHHATSVGKLFRPDNPLLPNYKWVPIGYHGRSSSIVVSGSDFHRPQGQLKLHPDNPPKYLPSERLDYELELGYVVGKPTKLGQTLNMNEAQDYLFGMTLLNDWSARDVQAFEYQPLGPFLAKNFATTLSPWVVTQEALLPYRVAFQRPAGDPAPLPHLDSADNQRYGFYDLSLSVYIQSKKMQELGLAPMQLSTAKFSEAAYWSPTQLIAHHASNGCPLSPGDVMGSGTLSGPQQDQAGSLLELTQGGKVALTLPSGEVRYFLEDGDTIIMTAHTNSATLPRIGFGECRGTVLSALVS